MPKRHFDFSNITARSPETLRFGIVIAQWNSEITASLYESAYQFLIKRGILKDHITVIEVPGSFELTSGADILLTKNNELDSVICLGCVIQGETRHFEFICNAVANGLTQVSIKYNKPVIFGVLTTGTFEQAKERAGGKLGNKGEEAAASALHMAGLRHI